MEALWRHTGIYHGDDVDWEHASYDVTKYDDEHDDVDDDAAADDDCTAFHLISKIQNIKAWNWHWLEMEMKICFSKWVKINILTVPIALDCKINNNYICNVIIFVNFVLCYNIFDNKFYQNWI